MHADSKLTEIGTVPLSDTDPRQIGSFPLRAVLGSGGMGKVYLGVAPTGYVAVKRIHPELAADADFLVRFGNELDNQSRLPSGVSVKVLASDRTSRPPWFATEYVPGVNVQEAVELAGGRLATGDCWALLRELAGRLVVLSRLGMVHRDLKPSNIMLTAGGGVTLIDFGLAVTDEATRITSAGHAVGTPLYMSPEQFQASRDTTPAVDVFALGGVIHFAATGKPPFGDGLAVSYRVLSQEPGLDELQEIDPGLAGIVARCLAKEPAARPSAAELAELAELAEGPRTNPAEGAGWRPSHVWPSAVTELIELRRSFAAVSPVVIPQPAMPYGSLPGQLRTNATGALGTDDPNQDISANANVTADRPSGTVQLDIGNHSPGTRPSDPDPDPAQDPDADADAGRTEPWWRRKRALMLIVVPVFVGTGAGIAAPHVTQFLGPGNHPQSQRTPAAVSPAASASASAASQANKASNADKANNGNKKAPAGPGAQAAPAGVTTGGAVPPSAAPAGAAGGGAATASGGSGSNAVSVTSPSALVSFSGYDMLKNTSAGLCLTDGNFFLVKSDACSGGEYQGWKATVASGNEFTLASGAGSCLWDNGGDLALMPCSSSSTLWEVGVVSGGLTLIDAGTGKCVSSFQTNGDSGFSTDTCGASDPRQVWANVGHD